MVLKILDYLLMVTYVLLKASNFLFYYLSIMAHITVSEEVVKEFERLKKELHELSPEQEITDDEIMEAMI
jgi:hypothetical protein